ncbi:MAG: hypothetical protein ACLTLQ_15655 [[Clostridium] scindens]
MEEAFEAFEAVPEPGGKYWPASCGGSLAARSVRAIDRIFPKEIRRLLQGSRGSRRQAGIMEEIFQGI